MPAGSGVTIFHTPRATLVDEIRVDGVIVNEVEHAGACVLDPHTHEGATIGILVDGGVAELRDDLVKVLSAGDVFVRRRGVRHANQYLPWGSRAVFVELEPDDRRARAIEAMDGLAWPELRAAGERVARAFREEPRGDGRGIQGRLEALVDAVVALRPKAAPGWLRDARERLAREYARPPELRQLAADVGVHPVYLVQAFRARFGVTPGELVRAHRVFHAVARICEGVPLAEVAHATGFADQSHMTRAVRASRGVSPGRLFGGGT